jgi:hypothetical protein
MDTFLKRMPPFKTSDLRAINRVRLYLQIYSRSYAQAMDNVFLRIYTNKKHVTPERDEQAAFNGPSYNRRKQIGVSGGRHLNI